MTAPLLPGANLPDLLSVSISGWMPTNPLTNPYVGTVAPPATADILRLDLVFNGLVNPPGPIQFPDNPTMYGPSPVYGYIDLDVDNDIDTGGEQPAGRYNYLEQIARFGAVPTGPLADRAVRSRNDVDFNFETAPFYERSGADFTLTLCGCTALTIVTQGGDGDGVFEANETWVVRGKFFQRSGGYQCASEAWGGFDIGLYEPMVDLQFHNSTSGNPAANRTTVSLIFPLTMRGASILTGQPEQPWDFVYGVGGNHFSVFEALSDVATIVSEGGATDECIVLAANWLGRDPADYLNVMNWSATALFGSTYAQHPLGASYVWSDVGFAQVTGDFNGDGRADATDRAIAQAFIAESDGGVQDEDGVRNSSFDIVDFPYNYSLYDINYDGLVNAADIALISPTCPADWDGHGGLNTTDFFAFLQDFFLGDADFNGDGRTDSADFMGFVSAFFAGCQ